MIVVGRMHQDDDDRCVPGQTDRQTERETDRQIGEARKKERGDRKRKRRKKAPAGEQTSTIHIVYI